MAINHKFTNRHEKTGDKCPRCLEIWRDFEIVSHRMLMCLQCGCYFAPKKIIQEANEAKLKGVTNAKDNTG